MSQHKRTRAGRIQKEHINLLTAVVECEMLRCGLRKIQLHNPITSNAQLIHKPAHCFDTFGINIHRDYLAVVLKR